MNRCGSRYLHSSDASTNCDREVQNALLMLKVSRILPSAGTSSNNASSATLVPSFGPLSMAPDLNTHHTSMQPSPLQLNPFIGIRLNTSTSAPFPSSGFFNLQLDPRMHHTSMQPSLVMPGANLSNDAPSTSSEVVSDSDDYWELESYSGGAGCSANSSKPLNDLELRVKALLLQQADLEKVGSIWLRFCVG